MNPEHNFDSKRFKMDITRLDILTKLFDNGNGIRPNNEKYSFQIKTLLISQFGIEGESDDYEVYERKIHNISVDLASKLKKFYLDSKIGDCKIPQLEKRKKEWLAITVKNPKPTEIRPPKRKASPPNSPKKRGRPTLNPEDEKCRSGQYAEASKTVGDNTIEKMLFAAMTKASKDGLNDLHFVLKMLYEEPAVNGSLFRNSMVAYNKPAPSAYTPEEALVIIIELGLTQRGYKKLRKKAKNKGTNIYPSYEVVLKCKKSLEPENIDKTKPDEVSVPMQDALDNQMTHILQLPKVKTKLAELIERCAQSGLTYELKLFFKVHIL